MFGEPPKIGRAEAALAQETKLGIGQLAAGNGVVNPVLLHPEEFRHLPRRIYFSHHSPPLVCMQHKMIFFL
jgi:hypothetical protein